MGGNPGLRAKDPAAMRKNLRARDEAHFDKLEAMRERTPRGRTKWQLSSVKMLMWSAPIGWSGLIVSASLASGPLARCFRVRADDSPTSCAA